MWTTGFRRIIMLVGAVLCWSVTAAAPATAGLKPGVDAGIAGADPRIAGIAAGVGATYRESFEHDLGGWQPDTDGRARRWQISRTPAQAVDGRYSLAYFLDGTWDDGTIWIERTIPVRPYADVTVRVSFWLHSPGRSFTSWPVVGVAGVPDPELESDLPIIGQADQRAGWAPYSFTTRVRAGGDGVLWVAAGISATWEVVRTYYVDLVEVTVEPV